ncbi:MAG: tetratricopeptide repeat protein [Thermoflexales bacterium]|nr:tetratricopeptide repeat protein [Thermoflexales bacterium]
MDRKNTPASLAVRWERSQALRQAGQAADAARALTAILECDPERAEAWQSLAELYQERGLERAAHDCLFNAHLLSGAKSAPEPALAHAYGLLQQGLPEEALALAQSALAAGEGSRLSAALTARAAWQAGQLALAESLCRSALYYWPACVQLHLVLAACLTDQGHDELAVEHLRLARTFDPGGEVSARWEKMGGDTDRDTDRDRDWAAQLAGSESGPGEEMTPGVLAKVGEDLGDAMDDRVIRIVTGDGRLVQPASNDGGQQPADNSPTPLVPSYKTEPSPVAVVPLRNAEAVDAVQLAGPEPSPPSPVSHALSITESAQAVQSPEPSPADDVIRTMQEAFEQLVHRLDTPARNRTSHITHRKSYRPFHAIISARQGLARVCGSRASIVERAMADLAITVSRYERVAAEALFVDDAASLVPFGLAPVRAADAGCIKQLLDELDDVLNQRGLQLASILIVGGDEIIPFCRLPNPADDPDTDVPTDVPYGCRSEDELLPQRLVGRMPHGAPGSDQAATVNLLLLQLGAALRARIEQKHSSAKGLGDLLRRLPAVLGWTGRQPVEQALSSFGYAASIWRRAAQEVFSTIGPARALRLSPPMDSADMGTLLGQVCPQLAYFNLHGLPDSPHWYGQRDPEFIADYSTFPVALSPDDIKRAVKVVFTAACYGAHLFGRDTQSSIALRFMQAGTLALVGSTTVAYGGLSVPLVGVDLLGQLFWQHMVSGYSSGEALRQAKLGFASQVQRRQGYLDGEDQKTLTSFILLGDPLLTPLPLQTSAPAYWEAHSGRRKTAAAAEALVLGRGTCRQADTDVPCEQLERVQAFVAHTLPEMADASVHFSHPGTCQRAGLGGSCKASKRAVSSQLDSPLLVSLSKTLPYDGRQGVQVVRVTVDSEGKILKLAVSK